MTKPVCGLGRCQKLQQATHAAAVIVVTDNAGPVSDGSFAPAKPIEDPTTPRSGCVAAVDQTGIGLAGMHRRQYGP